MLLTQHTRHPVSQPLLSSPSPSQAQDMPPGSVASSHHPLCYPAPWRDARIKIPLFLSFPECQGVFSSIAPSFALNPSVDGELTTTQCPLPTLSTGQEKLTSLAELTSGLGTSRGPRRKPRASSQMAALRSETVMVGRKEVWAQAPSILLLLCLPRDRGWLSPASAGTQGKQLSYSDCGGSCAASLLACFLAL